MSLINNSAAINFSATEVISTVSSNNDVHGAAVNPTITPLTDGTGANKAQKVGRKVFTLSTGNLDVDLTAFAGGINDAPINFAKVKEIYIKNLDAAIIITVNTTVFANAWTNYNNGLYTINPLGIEPSVDHFVGIVVSGANKLLRLIAASGAPLCEVFIVGEGA